MIKVREGQILEIGNIKVKAVKEQERRSCTGCIFNSGINIYCFKYLLNCSSNKLIFKKVDDSETNRLHPK